MSKSCLVFLVVAVSTAFCQDNSTVSGPQPPSSAQPVMFDIDSIDPTIDPCADFYRYACGGWLSKNPVPADQSRWRRWNEVAEWNNYFLYRDMKSAAEHPKNALQVKYGNYFAACMNREGANTLGAKPLRPILRRVDHWSDKRQLANLLGRLDHDYGQELFFEFGPTQDLHHSGEYIGGLKQGIYAFPSRDGLLTDDDRYRSLRLRYESHIQRVFELLGDKPQRASTEADSALKVETAIANSEMANSELSDPNKRYHILSLAQVQALSPSFNWTAYLKDLGEESLATINVQNPGFYQKLERIFTSFSVDVLRSYMRWLVVSRYASLLNDPLEREHFTFFDKALEGQADEKPLWRRCTAATDAALGDAVGQDWVAENFPSHAKESIERMVAALREALRFQIQSLDWMSDETKGEAEAKLDNMRVMIGYPDRWRDYSDLEVSRTNAVSNQIAVDTYDRKRDLHKIGSPVDRNEWFNTPPTVNAYTVFASNQIVFPAGMLQPPFFKDDADIAVNYGAIGSIVGHEMTHGFDTSGSRFDAKGNVREWWTPGDRKHFDDDAQCFIDEYSDFSVAPGVKQSGKRTVGENIADNGGLLIAYKALMASLANTRTDGLDKGFSPQQRFFIGFAQIHCQNQTKENILALAEVDGHSADQWRVNGTVRNMREFAAAFGCKQGQLVPTKVCRLW